MMSSIPRSLCPSVVVVCAALSACGSKTPTQSNVATKLEVIGGGDQVAGVGSTLPIKIVVKTSNSQGSVSGVAVSAATESSGGGSAAPATVTTAANGQAEINWTLGSKLGAQTLTLSATSLPTVIVSATGQTGPVAAIFPQSNAFQFTVVSRAVTDVPQVRVTDAFGNPVSGVPITFDAPIPGSLIAGTATVTDANGLAKIGSWTIGPNPISYSVRAMITAGPASGTVTTFEARGVPASVVAVAGGSQTGNAGAVVPVPPAVRAARDDGSPLPGVGVTFTLASGGGVIQGGDAVTGQDGVATLGSWALGCAPGANQITAQALGVPVVSFTANGVPGVPATITAAGPTTQSGFFGNFVTSPPGVLLADGQGKPVGCVSVTFQLEQADGQIIGSIASSDFQGRAVLGGWRLGTSATQSIRALVNGSSPIIFTVNASAPPPSTFKLEVRFRTVADGCSDCVAPTTGQRDAFDHAATRWKEIILSGSAPYPVNETATSCYPNINETVDGLVIFAEMAPIDGVGNILGQAGPCILRDDHMFQPAVGVMRFDIVDLATLETRGQLNDVILHEMAHVLGFGTIWDFPDPNDPIITPTNPVNTLTLGRGSLDPTFTGRSTRSAFLAAVAPRRTFTGVPVPLENTGGAGTRDSHWREATVTTELMTGFISPGGTANPLSAFTATQFRDLGYVVNDAAADPFTFLASIMGPSASALPTFAPGFQLNEAPLSSPLIVIDRQGRHVAVVPRR